MNRSPRPAEQVAAALRRKDIGRARALLDDHGETLRPGQIAQFRARIALAEGAPSKAVQLLTDQFGPSPEQPQPALLAAQAQLALGQPEAAASAMANMTENMTPPVVRMRLTVLAATKDPAALSDLAPRVLTELQDHPGLQEYTLNCVLEADGIDRVLTLLETIPVTAPMRKTRLMLVASAIRGGNCDVVARSLDKLPQDDQLPMPVLRSFSPAALGRPLPEIKDMLTRAADRVTDEKSLVGLSQICIQLGLTELGKALFERGRRAYEPRSFPVLQSRKDLAPEETERLMSEYRQTMDWLGIPAEDRPAWLGRASVGMEFHKTTRLYSLIAPDYLPSIVERRAQPDMSPLKSLNAQGRAGIVATSHIGFILNTLDFFHDNDVDVTIVGGHILRKTSHPGGDRLHPIRDMGPKTEYARMVASTLKNNRLLCLAVDVGHQKPVTFPHHGANLNLHPTVPRLALRFDVPVIWISSYIVGSELRFDCEQLPPRDRTESDSAYATRLMTSCADRMREICLRDPINASWAPRSIFAKASKDV